MVEHGIYFFCERTRITHCLKLMYQIDTDSEIIDVLACDAWLSKFDFFCVRCDVRCLCYQLLVLFVYARCAWWGQTYLIRRACDFFKGGYN